MGSDPLREIILKIVALNDRRKKYSLLGSGGKQKNVLTSKNSPVFCLNFLKGVIHAPGHVTTLFLPANKTLRGFEHALLKQGGEKAILSTFWARPT
jgi:hypothetical protein